MTDLKDLAPTLANPMQRLDAAETRRSGWLFEDRGKGHGLSAALAVGVAVIIAYLFHDRSWWSPDDGAYAYVAWRILEGDVLGRDVTDLHPGYVNIANAAAMRVFGIDILSMRYPLAVLTVAQSFVTYWLLMRRGPLVAAVGAIAAAALTFVLFPNPTANWYALALAICAAALLSTQRLPLPLMAGLLGFVLGNAFLFRQLSAVFLAMGVLSYLAMRYRAVTMVDRLAVRITLALIALGLAGYLLSKGSVGGTVLFGIWPFVVLAHAWSAQASSAKAWPGEALGVRTLAILAAGAAVAFIPLALYHAGHGTFGSWLYDSLIAPFGLTGLDFFDGARFTSMAVQLIWFAPAPDPAAYLNKAYWLVLLLAPVALGIRMTIMLRRADAPGLTPLAVIAVFFGLVSIHFEIPVYLNYTSFLTLAGLLSLDLQQRERNVWTALVAGVCVVAVVFHAGQPLSRGYDAILTGRTVSLDAPKAHALASIRTTAQERSDMEAVLATIDRHRSGDRPILAAPFNPEFYFLAQERAPFRHGITALQVPDEAALRQSIDTLRSNPPAVFIHRRKDKYNTPEVNRLVGELSRWSAIRETVGEYDVYLDLDPRRSTGSSQ